MSETRKIFANNLSRLIAERGIEQQAIAFALDVGTSTVSAWVLGQRFPRADKMQGLAEYFNVSVSDLVDDPNLKKNGNGDLMELREQLRRRPGLRVLFDASKGATDQDLLDAASLIEGFKKRRDGEE